MSHYGLEIVQNSSIFRVYKFKSVKEFRVDSFMSLKVHNEFMSLYVYVFMSFKSSLKFKLVRILNQLDV